MASPERQLTAASVPGGLDKSQLLSDYKHYSPFICGICDRLVNLDAVVEAGGSQCYCRVCFEGLTQNGEQRQQSRTHNQEGEVDPTGDQLYSRCEADSHLVGEEEKKDSFPLQSLNVQPLHEAQPLAFKVLTLIQVSCLEPIATPSSGDSAAKDGDDLCCKWSGDYGHYIEHLRSAHPNVISSPSSHEVNSTIPADNAHQRQMSLQEPAINLVDAPGATESEVYHSKGWEKFHGGKPPSLERSPSLHDLLKSEAAKHSSAGTTAASVATEGEANQDQQQQSSTGSNEASQPRWTSNNSISTNPVTQKPRAYPSTIKSDSPPVRAERKSSDGLTYMAVEAYMMGGNNAGNSHQSTEKLGDGQNFHARRTSDGSLADRALEKKEKQKTSRRDYDASINSLGFNALNSSAIDLDDSSVLSHSQSNLEESGTRLGHVDPLAGGSSAGPSAPVVPPEDNTGKQKILKRAEKVKKQANAKFNKGDFVAARTLYTEAIQAMESIGPTSTLECELISDMLSNRAVTFFREKEFEPCLEDCDQAIGFRPTHDKSWIRKWRALVAMGDFDEACHCLDEGLEHNPNSKRIQEQIDLCREERALLEDARQLVKQEKWPDAKASLSAVVQTSSNIAILCLASRIHATLGEADTAVEIAAKAQKFSPKNVEVLEVQGYALFLSGETEKGAHVLFDAYCLDKNKKKHQEVLTRCQKTHSAFSQARASIKRGRYAEAVGHFSTAIKECGSIPSVSKLYLKLRTERAEAWLLALKFLEALKDCQDVLTVHREYPAAWVVRSEVLIALGKPLDAYKELTKIRKSWGADDPTIEEGYRRADFEMRVVRAEEDLKNFVDEMESGQCGRFTAVESLMHESKHRPSNALRSSLDSKSRGSSTSDDSRRRTNPTSNAEIGESKKGVSEYKSRGSSSRSSSRSRGDERHDGRSNENRRSERGDRRSEDKSRARSVGPEKKRSDSDRAERRRSARGSLGDGQESRSRLDSRSRRKGEKSAMRESMNADERRRRKGDDSSSVRRSRRKERSGEEISRSTRSLKDDSSGRARRKERTDEDAAESSRTRRKEDSASNNGRRPSRRIRELDDSRRREEKEKTVSSSAMATMRSLMSKSRRSQTERRAGV